VILELCPIEQYLKKTLMGVNLRRNGSHVIVGKGEPRETIPIHANRDLKKGLEKKLLNRLKNTKK